MIADQASAMSLAGKAEADAIREANATLRRNNAELTRERDQLAARLRALEARHSNTEAALTAARGQT